SFCYRLIMAPPEVIDYVVAHELCHLQHLNHSKRFYSLLDQVYPEHKIHSKWLKENGHGLVI
ncbi:MAG: M48 family metallopeptidase, partial [bacterium]|nr:M48 family metallopeptidase [bacterium]